MDIVVSMGTGIGFDKALEKAEKKLVGEGIEDVRKRIERYVGDVEISDTEAEKCADDIGISLEDHQKSIDEYKGVANKIKEIELNSNGIRNLKTTNTGKELTRKEKKLVAKLRGDIYSEEDNYFNKRISKEMRESYANSNISSSCPFCENIDGFHKSNAVFVAQLSDEQKLKVEELIKLRKKMPPITKTTVMQKVLTFGKGQVDRMCTNKMDAMIGGCISRAQDAAPYIKNKAAAILHCRLDYEGTDFLKLSELEDDIYVVRFTIKRKSLIETKLEIPSLKNGYAPPCTETGLIGSEKYLIPEYAVEKGKKLTLSDGAIFKINSKGEETLVAYYDKTKKMFKKID